MPVAQRECAGRRLYFSTRAVTEANRGLNDALVATHRTRLLLFSGVLNVTLRLTSQTVLIGVKEALVMRLPTPGQYGQCGQCLQIAGMRPSSWYACHLFVDGSRSTRFALSSAQGAVPRDLPQFLLRRLTCVNVVGVRWSGD